MALQLEVHRLQTEIEGEVKKFNQLEKKAQELVQSRSGLMEQENENTLVLKEMELLPETAKVYKQVGGVLIDQSRTESINTLNSRIVHIKSQIEATNKLHQTNEAEQKAMVTKIQKAKEAYMKLMEMAQQAR